MCRTLPGRGPGGRSKVQIDITVFMYCTDVFPGGWQSGPFSNSPPPPPLEFETSKSRLDTIAVSHL